MPITKTHRFVLGREIITLCCENYTNPTNTKRWQNAVCNITASCIQRSE